MLTIVLLSRFLFTTWRSSRFWWCRTRSFVLRLPTEFPPRTGKLWLSVPSSWPSVWPTPAPRWEARRTSKSNYVGNDDWYIHPFKTWPVKNLIFSEKMSLVCPPNFQHILRVLNTNIEGKTNVMFALTSIKVIFIFYTSLMARRCPWKKRF